MTTYSISLFEGHPLLQDGDHCMLLDTGAPTTIHSSERLEFCGEIFSCQTHFMGLTVEKLSAMLGTPITTLLGADILSNFKVMLDYKSGKVAFDRTNLHLEGAYEINMATIMGVPIIELSVGGQLLKCFLDTGATLSYLPKALTQGRQSLGVKEDFYPSYGRFQTEHFALETRLGQSQFTAKYGHLPPLLETTLSLGGASGILGYDFFDQFTATLDWRRGRLAYRPVG